MEQLEVEVPSTIALELSMIVRALVVLNPIALNARRDLLAPGVRGYR